MCFVVSRVICIHQSFSLPEVFHLGVLNGLETRIGYSVRNLRCVIGCCSAQYYDVRKECNGDLCYDFSNLEMYLSYPEVREALGVGDRKFLSCSPLVYEAMIMDWMKNPEMGIPALLEDGIQMLVYAGEYDLMCNWLGKFERSLMQEKSVIKGYSDVFVM